MGTEWLERTELLIQKDGIDKLKSCHVLIVGLGGVGAYAAEMICRAGIGKMTIVDGDIIDVTNINRQLPATHSNIGNTKSEVLAQRFKDINPEIELTVLHQYYNSEDFKDLLSKKFDYVVDAIDTLSPKVSLIHTAVDKKIPLVSSMGAGGKLDPSMIKISDISKSYNCRLAKVLRKRLGKLGIRKGFKVVFSNEDVPDEVVREEKGKNKKSTVGTISYLPAIFGCFCASAVITDLLNSSNPES